MIDVASENLKAVGYEDAQSWLVVNFRNGRNYRYLNVPKSVFDSLLAAPSKGTYFNQRIKDKYQFVRLAYSTHKAGMTLEGSRIPAHSFSKLGERLPASHANDSSAPICSTFF